MRPSLLDDLNIWSDHYGYEFENRDDLKEYLLNLREEIDEQLAECNTTP